MPDVQKPTLRFSKPATWKRVSLVVDGQPFEARAGESVAAALLAAGRRVLRSSPHLKHTRGLFCAMGVCQECVVRIDGQLRTSCTTLVKQGMEVVTGQADV